MWEFWRRSEQARKCWLALEEQFRNPEVFVDEATGMHYPGYLSPRSSHWWRDGNEISYDGRLQSFFDSPNESFIMLGLSGERVMVPGAKSERHHLDVRIDLRGSLRDQIACIDRLAAARQHELIDKEVIEKPKIFRRDVKTRHLLPAFLRILDARETSVATLSAIQGELLKDRELKRWLQSGSKAIEGQYSIAKRLRDGEWRELRFIQSKMKPLDVIEKRPQKSEREK